MTRKLRYLLSIAILGGISTSGFAQEVAGKVLDENKEPMINAVVQVLQGGVVKGGNITDIDGNYEVKPLDPGTYDVIALYSGYDTIRETGVMVYPGTRTTVNFNMQKPKGHALPVVTITAYQVPLVNHDTKEKILTKAQIDVIPATQVEDLVATSTNTYQSQRGGSVQLGGARSENTQYIIDGVVVQNQVGVEMAQGSIEQLEVLTSGVPANYGDFTGGVVSITSRSVAQKLTGDVRVQHSIDGFDNNLVSFSVAGPLYKKYMGEGKPKKPVLGFTLSGDYYNDKDRYPYYNEQYVSTPAYAQYVETHPLTVTTNNTGSQAYTQTSNYATFSDFQQVKNPPNNGIIEYRMNGKLDLQVNDNIRLIGGGSVDYTSQQNFNRAAMLFAPGEIPTTNTFAGRGYLRFTQKFGKPGDTSARNNVISNAYYKIQADYQKTYLTEWDPRFKTNIFEYAYVGQFNQAPRQYIYQPVGFDSASQRYGTTLVQSDPGGISYTPDPQNRNPGLEAYDKQLFSLYQASNTTPLYMANIENDNGLANGDEPLYTYGMFFSPGTTQSFYSISNINQYSLDVSTNFDLLLGKVKHSIELGLYYQQRIESSYGINANFGAGTQSLWQLMRQLTSTIDNGGLALDKTHPIFKVNGQYYNYVPTSSTTGYFTDKNGNIKNINPTVNDTILYNYENVNPTTFDQNLRKKLGLAQNANINIDSLNPSVFSLGMFTADELLNSGNSYVGYSGYTYTGQLQHGSVNFDDFWTAKDAQGNYTRPIAPFDPNYTAGYIMDRFTFNDIHANLGLRVERYDYNTKILDDPYSLYQEETVNEVSGADNILNGGHHPSNMGGNYVVYVADNTAATPYIIGYRSGDNWYNAYGQLVTSPSIIAQQQQVSAPVPVVVKNAANVLPNITDSTFNPNNSFQSYIPQVILEPRIQFSFPVSDVADFFAHYDIYAQRPTGAQTEANASTYYFLENNPQNIIGNPALQPQRTFDYEVGFQQKLSDRSALTLKATYQERKDFIQLIPYVDAYPTTYYTYSNIDFTTVKGTSLYYDLRATNHLAMTISYTLQFAEGTGSTPTSTNSNNGNQIQPNGLLQQFQEAGQSNLRYITPLNIDSRHNIVADIDYRYKDGEGPLVSGNHILQNSGIHLIAKARSGEPYTAFATAQDITVVGGVNGSRLPWHYGMDLRMNKDFAINNLKRQKNAPEGIKPKKPLYISAILQVNNLLNTRDVLGVYGYTGRPDNNGYLTSPFGQQYVPQQISPTAYTDQYLISVNNPSNINYARTISLALQFNF